MSRTTSHELILNCDRAKCTCGRFSGPLRREGEPVQIYNHRATDAHWRHAAVTAINEAKHINQFDTHESVMGEPV